MYYMSEFCRVCLQSEKPLVDIMKKEAESETLINKLKLCVSEVEWATSANILMCQACIEKLNSAFEFKQQCLQSAQALENYISQLIGSDDSEPNRVGGKVYVSVNRNEVKQELVDEYVKIQKEEEESQKPPTLIRVKSNQQLYPQLSNIILTANNTQTGTFPNIFLNLIPSTAIKYQPNITIMRPNNVTTKPATTIPTTATPIKDANQNMFLNINNTLHKIFPIVTQNKEVKPNPPILKIPEEVNISKILTESKTEELSVDIDPMCFDCSTEEENPSEATADIAKDWEELISTNKIGPETLKTEAKTKTVSVLPKLSESSNFTPVSNTLTITPSKIGPYNQIQSPINNFVPIRPKVKTDYITADLEEKMMEFLNVDHFMASKEAMENMNESLPKSLICEQCGQICDTMKALRYHIKQFHLGKFPYKCRYCSSVYALKTQYDSHMQKHMIHSSDAFSKDTITLEDLSNQNEAILFPNSVLKPIVPAPTNPSNSDPAENSEDSSSGLQFDYKCEVCPRSFNSSHGLSRHKVRKHNQQTRRKYFVKGMKNAKCDICNREFSTQSYLQLHIKLHYRKNDYRLKVFNKDKYDHEKRDDFKSDPEDCDIKEVLENIEEATSNICKENNSEEIIQTESIEEPIDDMIKENDISTPKQSEGIKIKINLRNLKQSTHSKIHNKNSSVDADDTLTDKAAMDVDVPKLDEETLTNGSLEKNDTTSNHNSTHSEHEDRISSDSSDASHDMNMDCDESVVMSSPNTELSEETESLKDEGLPEEGSPPIKSVLVDGKPQCTFCYKLFSRKHDLKRHVNNIHLKAIQFVCHLCNSQFYEAFHLTRHLRQHNSFVRCTTCIKDFSVLRDLKLHILAVHDNAAPSQCGTCGQIFQKIKHLREHMHQHDKSIIYKCHICSDEFKESRELSKHLVGHSGMYSCNTCQTTFTTEHELENHMKCHTGDPTYEEKKYECEICHNKYKKKRYLTAHVNNRHLAEKQNAVVPLNRVESENDSS